METQRAIAGEKSAVDEDKVLALTQMLKDRLDLVPEGDWPIYNRICEESNGSKYIKGKP